MFKWCDHLRVEHSGKGIALLGYLGAFIFHSETERRPASFNRHGTKASKLFLFFYAFPFLRSIFTNTPTIIKIFCVVRVVCHIWYTWLPAYISSSNIFQLPAYCSQLHQAGKHILKMLDINYWCYFQHQAPNFNALMNPSQTDKTPHLCCSKFPAQCRVGRRLIHFPVRITIYIYVNFLFFQYLGQKEEEKCNLPHIDWSENCELWKKVNESRLN